MVNNLDGRFWISKSEHSFLGKGRIELLKQIDIHGSITKAAKAMKMSYKAAWDSLDVMNNLAEQILVETIKGGKGGGGTHLTDYAKDLIHTYEILNEEHQRFLNNLSLRINKNNGHLKILESMSMRVSARNQIVANVTKIDQGAVNSEIYLQMLGGDILNVIITNDSVDLLDIKIGTTLYALFKANTVMLSTDLEIKLSTSNRFRGTVSRISKGGVNAEIIIALKGGNTICSSITLNSLEELALEENQDVLAFCGANSIILGVQ